MTLAGFPVQRLHCGWLSLHSKAVRLSTRRRPSAISTLSAFALVATVALGVLFAGTEPAIAQNSVSICSRTQQVQTAILAELPDVSDCALVTSTNLAGITMLNLGSQSITALQAGDFDGLSSLQMLDLGNNQVSTLPAGVFDGLSSLQVLVLAFDNVLSTLPDGVFDGLSSLQELEFVGIHLTTLPAGVFDDLSSLQELSLKLNQLSTLPVGVFDGLSSLQVLDLGYNRQLSTLPAGVFDGLYSLQVLDLSGNRQLSTLPDGVFDGLSSLQVLDLGYNRQLSTLPAGVFDGLSSLQVLDLSSSQLSTLPGGVFDGLSSLQKLRLVNIGLTTLPDGVFDGLSGLGWLDLGFNQLSTLPGGVFDGLSRLGWLHLTDNPGSPFLLIMELKQTGPDTFVVKVADGAPFAMTTGLIVEGGTLPIGVTSVTVPSGSTTSDPITVTPTTGSTDPVKVNLGTAPSLPADFSGLQIAIGHNLASICSRTQQVQTTIHAELPDVIDCALVTSTNLEGIPILNLKSQRIAALRAGDFDGLSSLQVLDLSGNQLSTLPDGMFDGLSSLRELDLLLNQLSTLPCGVFDGLSGLQELSLGHNYLSTLPHDVFDGLSGLGWLDLGGNWLRTLPAGVFDGLSRLGWLDLRDNQLRTLPAGVFDGLSSLGLLELRYNQLRTLPNGVFDGLSGLGWLDLRDNPGSPFLLTMKLEQTGPDTFVVKVAEGAPFAMTTGLTVEGGTLPVGVSSVTVPAGSTTSDPITVAPTTGSTTRVEVSLGTVPSLPGDFSGLQIAMGGPLVLRAQVDVDEPPSQPEAPKVRRTGQTELTVSWTAPDNQGPEITNYDVQYRDAAGELRDAGYDGTGTFMTLKGLRVGTTYEVQVRAVNAEGAGPWSDSGQGETEAVPEPTATVAEDTGGGFLWWVILAILVGVGAGAILLARAWRKGR